MTGTRHGIKALLVTALLGFTHQGYAEDGGNPPGEPFKDGSISKTVLHAGQEGENLLKTTAWQALEAGYHSEGSHWPRTSDWERSVV